MADYIRVDTGQMREDSEEIDILVEEIPNQIKELEAVLIELSHTWEGDAHEAFQAQMLADLEYMTDVYRIGKEYVNSFDEARKAYQTAELNVQEEVGTLYMS